MPTIRIPTISDTANPTISGSRKPTCARCRNHMKIVPLKGHKRVCPHAICECDSCKLVSQRQQIMAKQQSHRRKLIFNAEEKPKLDKQMQSLEEGAFKLPGLYCCGKCGITFNTPDDLIWHIQRKHQLIFVEGSSPTNASFYFQSPSTSKINTPPPSPFIDVVNTPAPEQTSSPRHLGERCGEECSSSPSESISSTTEEPISHEPLCLATSVKSNNVTKHVKSSMTKVNQTRKRFPNAGSLPLGSKVPIRRPWMEESNLFPWLSYSNSALQNMTALQQCSLCWPPTSRWPSPNFYINSHADFAAIYRNLSRDHCD